MLCKLPFHILRKYEVFTYSPVDNTEYFSTLSFIGYQNGSEIQQMSDTNKMCSEIVKKKKKSISAMPINSLQATDGKSQHNWSSH